jgi:predicted RNA-binding Zn ribbon-like protein
VTDAPLLVALANAGRARRPSGARTRLATDPLANAPGASELLTPFLGRRVTAAELPALRRLQKEASTITNTLIRGATPDPRTLNQLAASCLGQLELQINQTGGTSAAIRWRPAPAAATLARQVIEEVGELDPARLRRCARADCQLVFYDTTRPGTQRWHSESPCGWRERQNRHRQRSA